MPEPKDLVLAIERVIQGKPTVVELVVTALLAGGHVLLEDVPGVGKTMLARALAASVDGLFKRVQCTPDLLPADITGVSVFDPATRAFEFREGPVFAQILLADEINRATPRTQAALLEAMEEQQVTVDGVTRPLPRPFFVIATQNPIELAGTFPLPEAQLDRFLMKLSIGYPSDELEVAILAAQRERHPLQSLEAVLHTDDLLELQQQVRALYVHPSVLRYVQQVVAATRADDRTVIGASPRASVALMRAGQAWARVQGARFVSPAHIKYVARAVLGHRLVVEPHARAAGTDGARIVDEVLAKVEVPVQVEPS